MKIRKIFISGMPRCGKTTLILELVEKARKKGKKIAGIITPEIRKDGKREGFWIMDLVSDKREVMAKKTVRGYEVNVAAIERISKEANKHFEEADVIFIDEIGKMELKSKYFCQMFKKLLNSNKKVIATLHRSLSHVYTDFKMLWLGEKNKKKIKEKLEKFLEDD